MDGGRAPTVGSRASAHWLDGTALVLDRLRAAGAVVVGYANSHEWMVGTTSLTSAFGSVINPRDHSLIAGGSSGGSAAALAANLVPLALGSDAGGSIRIPAACCGVVGLKPSWGLVPTHGFVDDGSSIDHVGPMATCVDDVHVLLEVLADRSVERPEVHELRLGVATIPFFEDVDPDVKRVALDAVEELRPHVSSVVEVSLPGMGTARHAIAAFILRDVAQMLERHHENWRELLQPETRRVVELGAAISDAEREEAEIARERMRAVWDSAFDEVDVIVTPTLPGRIATVSDRTVKLPSGTSSAEVAYVAWNGPMNLGGVPSLSVPCGTLSDGQSVNLSLTAARGNDGATTAVGGLLESLQRSKAG